MYVTSLEEMSCSLSLGYRVFLLLFTCGSYQVLSRTSVGVVSESRLQIEYNHHSAPFHPGTLHLQREGLTLFCPHVLWAYGLQAYLTDLRPELRRK